jgi:hypothetical protein
MEENSEKTLQREAGTRAFDPVFAPTRPLGEQDHVRGFEHMFRAIARRRPSMAANRTAVKIRLGLIETRNALKSGIVVSGCGGARTGGPVGVKPLRLVYVRIHGHSSPSAIPGQKPSGHGEPHRPYTWDAVPFRLSEASPPGCRSHAASCRSCPRCGHSRGGICPARKPSEGEDARSPTRGWAPRTIRRHAETRIVPDTRSPAVAYGRAHQNLALTISGCLA